jgi:hypothetical protein
MASEAPALLHPNATSGGTEAVRYASHPPPPRAPVPLRGAASRLYATAVAAQGFPAPLPAEAALARRHHPRGLRAARAPRETRRPGPPPRFHLVRYHGILGPCAGERSRIVPGSQAAVGEAPVPDAVGRTWPDAAGASVCAQAASDLPPDSSDNELAPAPPRESSPETPRSDRPRRLAWAELLRRVFAVDARECPRCGGRMRILAAIHPPDVTQAILECLQLPSRAPPAAAARPNDAEEGGPRSISMREAALDTGA